MQRLSILIIVLFLTNIPSYSQIVFTEDFEGGMLPHGWSKQTLAADGGWKFGEAEELSGSFWTILDNGSKIAVTNDDKCNCNKKDDYLISPPINLSNINNSVALELDILFQAIEYQNTTEKASIRVSTDGANTWEVVAQIGGNSEWTQHTIDLSAYIGQTIQIGFHYSDNNNWLYGMAIDNIKLFEPIAIDVAMTDLEAPYFGIVNHPMTIKGAVTNLGSAPINTLEVAYEIQEQLPESTVFDSLEISFGEQFEFTHQTPWMPGKAGDFNLKLKISDLNGGNDFVPENDFMIKEIKIYEDLQPPNIMNNFVLAPYNFTTILEGEQLNNPTDLDFFPALSKNELWVVNARKETEGGNATIITNAGKDDQIISDFEDINTYSSMSLPTSIAFGDNGNWATGSAAQDANHDGGIYSGPSLWTANPDLINQENLEGSHLDMLHGSPHSMGVAHERDNVYWVFDGFNGEIVRYDFQKNNGIGSTDFSDGIIRRYTEVHVERVEGVPSHLVIDKNTNSLYIVDTGRRRILRLKTTSGQVVQDLPIVVEPLEEHSRVSGVVWNVVIDQGLQEPSGIEIIGSRILVSDYATGDIIIYSMSTGFEELGRIETGKPGICGIKVGPEGNIWYVNKLENTLTKVTSTITTSTIQPTIADVKVTPNPSTGIFNINAEEGLLGAQISVMDMIGRPVFQQKMESTATLINLENHTKGMYFLRIENTAKTFTQKIIID